MIDKENASQDTFVMATSKQLQDELKAQLLKLKGELESDLKDMQKVPDMGDDVDSFEEEADEATALSNQLGIKDVDKKRLDDVNLALDKMEKGTYGVCEECSAELTERILRVVPETHLCQKCKKMK